LQPARRCSRSKGEILVEVIKAQDDVAEFAVAVRHVQLGDDGSVIGDFGDEAVGVGQGEKLHRCAVG